LENLETDLKKKNIKTIQLYVFAHNQAAIKLYEKLGYVVENSYFPIGYLMKKVMAEE
jgi:ribosomal protein S18 acetylase RimI-like enzyme